MICKRYQIQEREREGHREKRKVLERDRDSET